MSTPSILTAALLLSSVSSPEFLPDSLQPCNLNGQSLADLGVPLQKVFKLPPSEMAKLEISVFSDYRTCQEFAGDKLRENIKSVGRKNSSQSIKKIIIELDVVMDDEELVPDGPSHKSQQDVLYSTKSISTPTTMQTPSTVGKRPVMDTTTASTTPSLPLTISAMDEATITSVLDKIDFYYNSVYEAAQLFLTIPNHENYVDIIIERIYTKIKKYGYFEPLTYFSYGIRSPAAFRASYNILKPHIVEDPRCIFLLLRDAISLTTCLCFREIPSNQQREHYYFIAELTEVKVEILKNFTQDVVFKPFFAINTANLAAYLNPHVSEVYLYFKPYLQNQTISMTFFIDIFGNNPQYFCVLLRTVYEELIANSTDSCLKMELHLLALDKIPYVKKQFPEADFAQFCTPWVNKVSADYRNISRKLGREGRVQCYHKIKKDHYNLLLKASAGICDCPETRIYYSEAVRQPSEAKAFRSILHLGYCELINTFLWSYLKQNNLLAGVPTVMMLVQAVKRLAIATDEVEDRQYCEQIVQDAPQWAKKLVQGEKTRCRLLNRLSGKHLVRLDEKEGYYFQVSTSNLSNSSNSIWSISFDSNGLAQITDSEKQILFINPLTDKMLTTSPETANYPTVADWYFEPDSEDVEFFTILSSTINGTYVFLRDKSENCTSSTCPDFKKLEQWKLDCIQ